MIGIDEAVRRVLAEVRPVGGEDVGLLDAVGRTLAEEVVAGEDVPPFANSAMDGFAVRGEDLRAGLRELVLVDEVPAGYVSQVRLAPGQAAKIMTGAPLPEGADTVVPVELTEAAGATVSLHDTVAPAANVRAAGEDIRRGDTVFASGQALGPAEIGLLASLGHSRLHVTRRPRVAVLATGSELVPLGEAVGPGQIRNSNSYTAYGQVLAAGGEPVLLGIARDDRDETRRLVARALEEDVAITSGGVSVGEFDFVKDVQDELGVQRLFWGVRVKPGKPISFGTRDGTLVFGVPGNPVAAMVCFELYVRPALLAMQGRADIYRPHFAATSGEPVTAAKDRVEARRCRLGVREGAWTFSTTGPQGSGILRSMALADGLVFVPSGFGGGPVGTTLTAMLLAGSSTQRPPYPECAGRCLPEREPGRLAPDDEALPGAVGRVARREHQAVAAVGEHADVGGAHLGELGDAVGEAPVGRLHDDAVASPQVAEAVEGCSVGGPVPGHGEGVALPGQGREAVVHRSPAQVADVAARAEASGSRRALRHDLVHPDARDQQATDRIARLRLAAELARQASHAQRRVALRRRGGGDGARGRVERGRARRVGVAQSPLLDVRVGG